MLNGEFEKALESYTKALELDPDNKCCLVARSKCYLHIGDPMKALKVSIFQSTINSCHVSNYGWVRPYGSNNGSLRCRLSRKIWARGTQTCAPAWNRPCSPNSVSDPGKGPPKSHFRPYHMGHMFGMKNDFATFASSGGCDLFFTFTEFQQNDLESDLSLTERPPGCRGRS